MHSPFTLSRLRWVSNSDRWPAARLVLVVGVGALLFALAAPGSAEARVTTGAGIICRDHKVAVSLAEGQPRTNTIFGELCATQSQLTDGGTIQLLIHGATYDHTYWNFPLDNAYYSYAKHLVAAGFPTFAIDEIGAGSSSHPVSTSVPIEVAAFVAHQIVQELRGGTISGTHFGKVIGVGHSLGSRAALQEAITYQDVDGVIVTGLVHHVSPAFLSRIGMLNYPANQDPEFAKSGLDDGYLTTRPGARGTFFYNADFADPAVIAADEAGKTIVPGAEIGGFPQFLASTATRAIKVPVLIILGSRDLLGCDATYDCSSGSMIAREEAPFYSSQPQACSVTGSGHSVSLHLNHWLQEVASIEWSWGRIGQRGLTIGSGQLPPGCG
jgi:pimeloyl-ACP methyl ester carboxylesterase